MPEACPTSGSLIRVAATASGGVAGVEAAVSALQDAPQADAEEEEETAALTDEAEEGEFPALSEEPKKKSVVAVEEIEIAVAPAAVEASSNNPEEPESNAIAPAKKAVGCSCAIM